MDLETLPIPNIFKNYYSKNKSTVRYIGSGLKLESIHLLYYIAFF